MKPQNARTNFFQKNKDESIFGIWFVISVSNIEFLESKWLKEILADFRCVQNYASHWTYVMRLHLF